MYILIMCKAKNPFIGGSRGIESPSNQVDASNWSIHLIECSTSSFLIFLIAVMVTLYLFKKYQVCCFRGQGVVVEDRRLSRAMPMQELGPAQNGALANGGFQPI